MLAALAWAAVASLGAAPRAAGAVAMPAMPGVTGAGTPGLAWLIGMWAVMMVAMMLPSAAPTILLFSGVSRRRRLAAQPAAPVAVFTLGYLAVWTVYAAVAGTAQWELHHLALLSPSMSAATPWLAGGLLVAAGVYQWLPIKAACLSSCRSPLGFFTTEWRDGVRGALIMGMRHGTFCVGCCWLLMALLFVAGVMNLLWITVIAGFVLVEKLMPRGAWVGRAGGLGLIAWGLWIVSSQ